MWALEGKNCELYKWLIDEIQWSGEVFWFLRIIFEIPKEVKVSAEAERGKNPIITLESHDKQLIGHIAAKIRSFRKPEPYKGKGIKFVGEQLRRKAGKSAAK